MTHLCTCYLAHGVEHLCANHETHMPIRADLWVESDLCRVCICDELERLEGLVVLQKERLRRARYPQSSLVGPRPIEREAPPTLDNQERGR